MQDSEKFTDSFNYHCFIDTKNMINSVYDVVIIIRKMVFFCCLNLISLYYVTEINKMKKDIQWHGAGNASDKKKRHYFCQIGYRIFYILALGYILLWSAVLTA